MWSPLTYLMSASILGRQDPFVCAWFLPLLVFYFWLPPSGQFSSGSDDILNGSSRWTPSWVLLGFCLFSCLDISLHFTVLTSRTAFQIQWLNCVLMAKRALKRCFCALIYMILAICGPHGSCMASFLSESPPSSWWPRELWITPFAIDLIDHFICIVVP